jgi:hypothetical protein
MIPRMNSKISSRSGQACGCRVDGALWRLAPRQAAKIQIQAPQWRKKLRNVFRGRRVGLWSWRCCRGRRLKRLEHNIFSVLKSACLETLIDERLDFGRGDLNGRLSGLLHHYAPDTSHRTHQDCKRDRGPSREKSLKRGQGRGLPSSHSFVTFAKEW